MEKHEDNLEKLLKAELEKEAGEIMEEMDSDESLQDVSFPEDLDEKMWSKIQEYEEQQEAYEKLSDTDKEAIRLGREIQALRGEDDKDDSFKENAESNRNIDNVVPIDRVKHEEGGNGDDKEKDTEKSAGKRKVRRKRHWKVYGIVAIVAALAMMWSMVSIGGTPFFGKLWTQKIGDRKMTQVDTEREDGDKNKVDEYEEESVYEEIKKEMGVDVVRLDNMPSDLHLQVKDIDTALKRICLIYGNDDITIEYQIVMNYKEQSHAYDIEDEKIKEEQIEKDGNKINISQYQLSDGTKEWVAQFNYRDAFYTLNAVMNEEEFKNLLNNLYFS